MSLSDLFCVERHKPDFLELVKNNNKIKKNLIGKNVIREIYVPGKIVNLVVK